MQQRLGPGTSIGILLLAVSACAAAPASPLTSDSIAPSPPTRESATASPQPTPTPLATPTASTRPSSSLAADTPGDFAHMPGNLIHRERTPPGEPVEAVVVRIGRGPAVVNVDGPTG
jgi:glucose/arabinose dehydrogenase